MSTKHSHKNCMQPNDASWPTTHWNLFKTRFMDAIQPTGINNKIDIFGFTVKTNWCVRALSVYCLFGMCGSYVSDVRTMDCHLPMDMLRMKLFSSMFPMVQTIGRVSSSFFSISHPSTQFGFHSPFICSFPMQCKTSVTQLSLYETKHPISNS